MPRETRTLPVALTDMELVERSDKLAHLVAKIDKLDDERKEVNSNFKERREELEAAARQFAREIRERSADREIEVREMADDKRFVVEWVRQDNLTVVEARPMTEGEVARAKQGKLPFREPPPPKSEGKAKAAEKPAETPTKPAAAPEPAAAKQPPELRSVKGGAKGEGPGAA